MSTSHYKCGFYNDPDNISTTNNCTLPMQEYSLQMDCIINNPFGIKVKLIHVNSYVWVCCAENT